ncbi:ATP-dependent RecD-like DNA helicase [Lacticaseibacillus jixianensis]|uniref:ATP-dependent RecD2 DNA helicase n=1 Tax=Lacticaseibacillus jixianensis TaxID=2486012 RepID=A0ABW4B7T4_9LACO|nr:ATP-dependent RecD-like DNA helicase [Lacticaseibacillus jixianensis]
MNEDAQQSVSGRVKSIIFQSPTTFFKIIAVTITKTNIQWPDDEITVTGNFGDIKEDETYSFVGKVVNHPRYGLQFAADNYQIDKPTSKQGLVNYLASDRFPGIGTITAQKIVDALGVKAIDKILKDENVLKPLGLNAEKRATLVDNLQLNLGMEQVIIGLNDFGFSANMAAKIYQKYKTDALDVIEENPYQLIADIDGIGFKRADAIAAKLNIKPDAQIRLGGAVLAELQRLTDGEGDTYVMLPALVNAAVGILEGARNVEVDPNQVGKAILALTEKGELYADGQRIFPRRLYDAEGEIATRLATLQEPLADPPSDQAVAKLIKNVEKSAGIRYDDTQKAAIQSALQHEIFLLTGGPGTGKTTVVNGIVRAYAALNGLSLDLNDYKDEPFPLMLAAPTGRAAKRIMETTGLPASTIHRLLGLAVDAQEYEPKDLPDGLLVVDEMSMVDTYLFRTLLAALHPGIKIILVGDKDQLPSVGPGQVFADLLRSRTLPAMELKIIHRQDEESSIIPLAHAINAGKLPPDWRQSRKDRSFILCPPEQLARVVGQVVAKAATQFDQADVQVLAPMYRGPAGIDQLNPLIQDILNPRKTARTKEVEFGPVKYRIGDKVLQLVNNPDANVFNGELGVITGITAAKEAESKTDELTIDFDGNELQYQRSDWSKITLAYATSIHKAQGSEFPVVVLPLTLGARRMLRRNLLYTAVTRARDFLILMGDPRAFETAVEAVADNRQTALIERLTKVMPADQPDIFARPDAKQRAAAAPVDTAAVDSDNENKNVIDQTKEYRLTKANILAQTIDPRIGLNGLTPAKLLALQQAE